MGAADDERVVKNGDLIVAAAAATCGLSDAIAKCATVCICSATLIPGCRTGLLVPPFLSPTRPHHALLLVLALRQSALCPANALLDRHGLVAGSARAAGVAFLVLTTQLPRHTTAQDVESVESASKSRLASDAISGVAAMTVAAAEEFVWPMVASSSAMRDVKPLTTAVAACAAAAAILACVSGSTHCAASDAEVST